MPDSDHYGQDADPWVNFHGRKTSDPAALGRAVRQRARRRAHGGWLHAEAYARAARDVDPAEGAARLRELAGGDGRSLRQAAGWFGHAVGQPLELDGAEVRVAAEVGRRAAGLLELAAAGCAGSAWGLGRSAAGSPVASPAATATWRPVPARRWISAGSGPWPR
jgi:hypothetical protein